VRHANAARGYTVRLRRVLGFLDSAAVPLSMVLKDMSVCGDINIRFSEGLIWRLWR